MISTSTNEDFALNNEKILRPTRFKTIMRSQQINKYLGQGKA